MRSRRKCRACRCRVASRTCWSPRPHPDRGSVFEHHRGSAPRPLLTLVASPVGGRMARTRRRCCTVSGLDAGGARHRPYTSRSCRVACTDREACRTLRAAGRQIASADAAFVLQRDKRLGSVRQMKRGRVSLPRCRNLKTLAAELSSSITTWAMESTPRRVEPPHRHCRHRRRRPKLLRRSTSRLRGPGPSQLAVANLDIPRRVQITSATAVGHTDQLVHRRQ